MKLDRVPYAVLTLLFTQIGIHAFLASNVKKGIFTILSGLVTLGVVSVINFVFGILGAIKMFQMTDEEFEAADKDSLVQPIIFFYKE